MATITTDTYLDDGTARTAGEAWTINGATLTVRTDTRWHANAPASMTGTLGGMLQLSAGGIVHMDGTKVRWMAFNNGTGSVPAIGTFVSQGGVQGYLLGVWADYVSAPLAVGATMPTSGYMKFREVTGGQFSVGALTGIGADAAEPDRVGWIEVVFDSNISIMSTAPEGGLKSLGDWFSVGTTNGTPGQTIQVPTMAGGANTWITGVQIETSPGSGVYEWYPSVINTSFTTTNLTTDGRAKFVSSAGNGQVMIGWTGAANAGYTPPAGCNIRVPNIFLRSATTAARTVNLKPSTSNMIIGNSSSAYTTNINFSHVMCDWSLNLYTANNFSMKNSVFPNGVLSTAAVYGAITLDNICLGSVGLGGQSFNYFDAGSIKNSKLTVSSGALSFSYCNNLVFENNDFVFPLSNLLYFSNCNDLSFTNARLKGVGISLTNSTNITINGIDYCSSCAGNTTSSRTGQSVFTISGGANFDISNITFGENGTYFPVAPYNSVFNFTGVFNLKLYNIGSRSTPAFPYDATNGPSTIFSCGSNKNVNIEIKRVYLGHARTYLFDGSGFNSNFKVINFGFPTASTVQTNTAALSNSEFRGWINNQTGLGNYNALFMPGWSDKFGGDSFGAVGNNRMNGYSGTLYKVASGSTSYTTNNSVFLNNNQDYYITEMPYFAIGHTGFKNTAFSVSSNGVANLNIEYQIDTGSGWNGTWKQLTLANLTAETISPVTGFKLKFKINNKTNTSYYIGGITLNTNSTLQAQLDNMYPLFTYDLSFTGLIPGSEVRCYVGTDPATAVELGGTEGTAGSTFTVNHAAGGQDGYIMILAMGYQPIRIPYTYKSVDDSILIQPVIDRNYNNPV